MPTALAFVRAKLGIAILPEAAAGAETSEFRIVPLNNRFSNRQIELLARRDAASRLPPRAWRAISNRNSMSGNVTAAAKRPHIPGEREQVIGKSDCSVRINELYSCFRALL